MIGAKESEETEVKKDKEGLVKYLEKEISNFKPGQMIYDYLTFILKQLNQLDEPEVLSDKWIDNNSVYASFDGLTGEYVHVDDLQNLLVPTVSEMEKVQLSQKTADELNRYKELGYSLRDLLVIASSKQAQEKLARAWLDGFTVKEEQKYYVINKQGAFALRKDTGGVANSIYTKKEVEKLGELQYYQLTEQEIKDYDERYFAFAVKVEELEE